jgi:hypothetical protein
MSFGIFGTIGNGTYNLAPGTIKVGDEPTSPYQIYFPSNTIIFQATCFVSPVFTNQEQIIIRFYKNALATPFISMTLSSAAQKVISTGFSTTISSSDYITATATSSGGVGNGHNISCTISLY